MPFLPFYDHIDPGQGGSAMVIPEYPSWMTYVKPEVFPCGHCNLSFDSYDGWFEHRFHAHPVAKPTLVLGEAEMVTPRFVMMRKLLASEIRAVNTEVCRVNGKEISLDGLAKLLATSTNAFWEITLEGPGSVVRSRYEISVELPDEEDLVTVEKAFMRLASEGNLSLNGVNNLIREAARATTAKRYLDGVSGYIFGVLGKDQRGNTTLTQEQGRTKLNEAHQTLALIDRPLARVIRAVIEFQANTFLRARGVRLAPRLLHAIHWFDSARLGKINVMPDSPLRDDVTMSRVPLDSATDELLGWLSLPTAQLVPHLRVIEKRCNQPDWLPDDRVKARVLLAALQFSQGNDAAAVQVTRTFRHDPVFQTLAEQVLAGARSATSKHAT